MTHIDRITAVILAGGKSSRMGTDKALLPYGPKNEPLIVAVINMLSGIFSRIMISAAKSNPLERFGLPLILDHFPEIGPLGGITSVLESGEERIFCVACDMPFLNEDLIRYQCSFTDDAVIPEWHNRWESLHSIYSLPLLPALRQAIEKQHFKISDALFGCNVRLLLESEIQKFDTAGKCFANINTPGDFERMKAEG